MADPRKERIAANEAMFRTANERAHEWEEAHEGDAPELYMCECADPDCRERIRLKRADYERARADSVHFAIASGHQIVDAEDVVEENEGWMMIEKKPDVLETVRATDPRR